jgi:hypothetical protein
MSGNFAALGEHTAHMAQARDAALRRWSLLNNLGLDLRRIADAPERPLDEPELQRRLAEVSACDREMRAALAKANAAGALCGQAEASIHTIGRVV